MQKPFSIIENWFIRTTDNKEDVEKVLSTSNFKMIPILESEQFIGYVNTSELVKAKYSLKNIQLSDPISAYKNFHILDLFKLTAKFKLDCIALVSQEGDFEGVVPLASIIDSLSHSLTVNSEGSVVVIRVNANDFELSKLVNIAESHNLKVLGVLTEMTEIGEYLIHLKLNSNDIQSFISSLNRFKFNLEQSYHVHAENDDLDRKYNLLMNYLDI